MPTVKDTEELAIGQTGYNPLDGSVFEYLERPAMVDIALLADSGDDDVFATVSIGTSVIAERFELDQKAVTSPVNDEDYQFSEAVPAGRKLQIRIDNENAGAVDVRTVVRITWL